MRVEVLYFDGCPTYRATHKSLAEVLSEEGLQAEVEMVAVNTGAEARRSRLRLHSSEDAMPDRFLGGIVGYPH